MRLNMNIKLNPAEMKAGERIEEIAQILARAILRLKSTENPPNPLDNQGDKSVYTPAVEKP